MQLSSQRKETYSSSHEFMSATSKLSAHPSSRNRLSDPSVQSSQQKADTSQTKQCNKHELCPVYDINSGDTNKNDDNVDVFLSEAQGMTMTVCPFQAFSQAIFQALFVKPESKVPKSRPKGLGLTLKSHGPPTPPTHHPLTLKHEGVLWYKRANSKSGSE